MSDLAQILRRFDQLQRNVQKKHARKAGRQAMKVVQDHAKLGAKRIDDPQTREKIYQNIVIRNGKSRNKNTVVTRVGIQGGAKVLTDGEVQGKGKKIVVGILFIGVLWNLVRQDSVQSPLCVLLWPEMPMR